MKKVISSCVAVLIIGLATGVCVLLLCYPKSSNGSRAKVINDTTVSHNDTNLQECSLVTFHSLNSSVSVFNTCKKDFFCEPTGTLSTIGLCVRQESQRKENTCWSSPSLCEKGLQCSVEPLFWKQQVQNTAQQMNDLAHFFLSNKTLPTSYQNESLHLESIVWEFIPLLFDVFLNVDLITLWTKQMHFMLLEHWPISQQLIQPVCRSKSFNNTLLSKPLLLTRASQNTLFRPKELPSTSNVKTSFFCYSSKRENINLTAGDPKIPCNFLFHKPCQTDDDCVWYKSVNSLHFQKCHTKNKTCVWRKNAACITEFLRFQEAYDNFLTKTPVPQGSLMPLYNLVCCLHAVSKIIADLTSQIQPLPSSNLSFLSPLHQPEPLPVCQNSTYSQQEWWIYSVLDAM